MKLFKRFINWFRGVQPQVTKDTSPIAYTSPFNLEHSIYRDNVRDGRIVRYETASAECRDQLARLAKVESDLQKYRR